MLWAIRTKLELGYGTHKYAESIPMVSVIYSWSFLLQFDCSAMHQANLLSGHCGSCTHRSGLKSVYSLCIINHMNHNCFLPLTMSLHLNSDLQPYTWTDGLSFNCKTNTGASFLVCTDWKTTRTDHDHDEIMTGSFWLCRTSCSSLALPETMIVRVSKLAGVGSWDFESVHLLL